MPLQAALGVRNARLAWLTSGEIRFWGVAIGRDVTALPARQRDIAMVFQSYALYPRQALRRSRTALPRLGRAQRYCCGCKVCQSVASW